MLLDISNELTILVTQEWPLNSNFTFSDHITLSHCSWLIKLGHALSSLSVIGCWVVNWVKTLCYTVNFQWKWKQIFDSWAFLVSTQVNCSFHLVRLLTVWSKSNWLLPDSSSNHSQGNYKKNIIAHHCSFSYFFFFK